MHDLSGAGEGGDESQGDVLDVPDERDAEPAPWLGGGGHEGSLAWFVGAGTPSRAAARASCYPGDEREMVMTSSVRAARAAWVSTLALVLSAASPRGTLAHEAARDLPSGERWKEHLEKDLLPFWTVPDALGTPRGNFPTYRCNDGRLIDPERPCPEAQDPRGLVKEGLEEQYVRMMGRQAYFYGVAYHLLGDPALLELARDGVDYLRRHALSPGTGSAATRLRDGEPAGPPDLERTAQDLAYAQVGMAMYYYLTRDPEVLRDIVRLKHHIFENYWDEGFGMMRWTVRGEDRERKELVAQLDQVNAYLLLLTPILPEPERGQWKADLVRLAGVLRRRFFSPREHLFFGRWVPRTAKSLGGATTTSGTPPRPCG